MKIRKNHYVRIRYFKNFILIIIIKIKKIEFEFNFLMNEKKNIYKIIYKNNEIFFYFVIYIMKLKYFSCPCPLSNLYSTYVYILINIYLYIFY